jgi:hypothetical protein
MAWRAYRQAIPLVMPLYYANPEREEAYLCPNQIYFGSELLVAPIVTPRHPETGLSRCTVWLPPGDWFDFTTGEHFTGDRALTLYGTLDDIPVFARGGGIVPLGPRAGWGGVDSPAELTVHAFAGADGDFTLYEDDGVSTAYLDGDNALIRFSQTWREDELVFRIGSAEGKSGGHVPEGRSYRIVLHGVREPEELLVLRNGQAQPVEAAYDATAESLTLAALPLRPADELVLAARVAEGTLLSQRDRRLETCRAMLWSFKLNSDTKKALHESLPQLIADPQHVQRFAGQVDRVTEAQLMALRNVWARR